MINLGTSRKRKIFNFCDAGWATHCDANHLSPIIKWDEVLNDTYYHMENLSRS